MKLFQKNILTGVLAIIVVAGAAASVYFGKLTPNTAIAEEKNSQLAKKIPTKTEDNPDISTLLQKMNMSEAADNSMMTDFELLDLDGNLVSLSQFKGETVLLGFFTTW